MYDGSVVASVMELYRARREEDNRILAQRREEIYKVIPEIEEIDFKLRECALEAASLTFSAPDPVEAVKAVGKRSLDLQATRCELLAANGYPYDYLNFRYRCKKCSDNGFIGSEPCECFLEACRREQAKRLSDVLDTSGCSFEAFRLDYYSDVYDAKWDVSARGNMSINLRICRDFADKFGGEPKNLLLYGGPGLGKTFLSSCIAASVVERGYSVVYDTAYNLFLNLENERFNRADDEARSANRRYFSCDLLILDDLGTEIAGVFATAALYNLLNSRLMKKKSTVINTNLNIDELERRYSAQIYSRIAGEFTPLFFFGNDIRMLRQLKPNEKS